MNLSNLIETLQKQDSNLNLAVIYDGYLEPLYVFEQTVDGKRYLMFSSKPYGTDYEEKEIIFES